MFPLILARKFKYWPMHRADFAVRHFVLPCRQSVFPVGWMPRERVTVASRRDLGSWTTRVIADSWTLLMVRGRTPVTARASTPIRILTQTTRIIPPTIRGGRLLLAIALILRRASIVRSSGTTMNNRPAMMVIIRRGAGFEWPHQQRRLK